MLPPWRRRPRAGTAFGPALIGQTEKALDAILVRELDGTEIRARLWGDLPEADLAAACRVLSTALTRANAELGYSI